MNTKVETIILISCLHFDCHPNEFFSNSKTRKSTYARASAACIIRKYTTMTLSEIAKLFNRTHMTIWAGINRVSNIIDNDIKHIEQRVSNWMSFEEWKML